MRPAFRRVFSSGSAVLVALAAGLAGRAEGSARQGLPQPEKITLAAPVSVVMESAGGRPVVLARLNGRGPYKLILDSAAAGSVFATELARELALPDLGSAKIARPGSKDTQPATLTKVAQIEIEGLKLEGVAGVAADLSIVQRRLSAELKGVLSATMLDGLLVACDYPAKRIEFRRGELPAADNQTIFAWLPDERLPSVALAIGGETVQVDLDTGSAHGFMLPQALAAKFEWLERPVAAGQVHTLDTTSRTATGRLKGEVRLGRFVFTNPKVSTNEGVLKTIGYEVLKEFVFTLDPQHRRFELRRD